MTYDSAPALRTALEQRLINRAAQTGLGLDRLRRGVLFERIVARLEAAQPGRWVLKGGMALEVRLRHDARVTKDIDLGLREEIATAADLQAQLGVRS
ncbi:MAG: nucleotidyl transferase AbiEii/AbiGii toxin family protein [Acidimicrobiales bacterium]